GSDAVGGGARLEEAQPRPLGVRAAALVRRGLLTGSVDEAIAKDSYRRFYMHRTSHWLGRDVHDVGRYGIDGAPRPLEPGMVFTVEPGLYVAGDGDVPEAFRGLGLRVAAHAL